ncbi:AgmX/PglI C-terminal domain-containing protein [Pendulispora albinea]|uniref:AgmX/PglI C-terminal domain-containing protein n=1 Tax=Pendulispora albinea TaxID=2741071 RepID=A0ABZ2M7B3_9BACT
MNPIRTRTRTRMTWALLLLAGCGETSSAPGAAPAPAPAAAAVQGTPEAALEQALVDADIGQNLAAARETLTATLASGAVSKGDRVRADLALAKLVESTDKERAIALLEDAASLDDGAAQKRLFRLLAGRDAPSSWSRNTWDAPPPPSAFAFARYFPAPTADSEVDAQVFVFGGDSRTTDTLGTFHVADALRSSAVDVCGACDGVKSSIHAGSTHREFWSAIPAYAAQMEKALVVLYVDEETMVPERYAKWLAAPAADLRAAFARGEGLVAVKQRPGAPPLVTVAAPRVAQLLTVEATLTAMDELPKQPVTVKLRDVLTKNEIQRGIRAHFGGFWSCYESLVTRRPDARGRANLSFTVEGSGKVEDARVALDGTLEDPELRACFEKASRAIQYPAWSKTPSAKTTVRYPLQFANGGTGGEPGGGG